MVATTAVEKTRVPMGFFSTGEKTRASVEVKGFLANNEKILKIISVTKNDDSFVSDLRAKRGAFKKCVKDVGKQFQEYLKTGK